MTNPPLIFGPVPPYSNVPIQPQYYQPSQFFISAITMGQITTITTTANTNYVVGQQVRLLIPNGFGARQLNEQTGFVTAIPAGNQVTINLNSSKADPFVTNAALFTQPQILAIGDQNSGNINTSGTYTQPTSIPGSFVNISPL